VNRLQLAQRVHLLTGAGDGSGLPGTRPTTTVGATGDLQRIVVSVDEAWRAIQTARMDWLFMRSEGLLPLVQDVIRYPVYQSSADITASVTGSVVTATVADTTGLVAGGPITVAGAVQPQYNGAYTIYDVPSGTTVRYLITGTPVTPATGSITADFGSGPVTATLAATSGVVTVNAPAHDFNVGQDVFVSGATQTNYNGTKAIISATDDTFRYIVPFGTTTPATGRLALAAHSSLIDFDAVRPYFAANRNVPFVLVYKTSIGTSDEQPMHFVEPHDFEGYFDRDSFATSVGRPVYYTILPNRRIAVFPRPDVPYTVRVPFRKRVQILAADTDEPNMPQEFHPMIAYKAIMDFMGFQENSRQFQNASRLYAEMWEDLCIQQLPRISSQFGAVR
jgi:hypothetical protein